MASRPWATPEDIKAYTDYQEVLGRDSRKLESDIARAEMKVIGITNNRFGDKEYPELPEPVRMAVILIAEAYAKNAMERGKRRIKSETFDDYSYTVESAEVSLDGLDLDGLLSGYTIAPDKGNMVMRLRKL